MPPAQPTKCLTIQKCTRDGPNYAKLLSLGVGQTHKLSSLVHMRRHLTMAHCMRTSSRKMQWAQLTSMWPLRIQTMPQVQTAVDQLGMGLRYTHKPSVDRQVFKLDAKVSSCSTDHLAIQAESEQHQHRRAAITPTIIARRPLPQITWREASA